MTTTTAPHIDVPAPTGASEVNDWEQPARTGYDQPSRYFTGTVRTVAAQPAIDVVVAGTQYQDGTAQREVLVNRMHADHPLTLEQARALGEAILAAANEAEADGRRDIARAKRSSASDQAIGRYLLSIRDELVDRLGPNGAAQRMGVTSLDEVEQFAAELIGHE